MDLAAKVKLGKAGIKANPTRWGEVKLDTADLTEIKEATKDLQGSDKIRMMGQLVAKVKKAKANKAKLLADKYENEAMEELETEKLSKVKKAEVVHEDEYGHLSTPQLKAKLKIIKGGVVKGNKNDVDTVEEVLKIKEVLAERKKKPTHYSI
jgi:hypothetical protein